LSVSGIGEYSFGIYKLTIKKFTDCSIKTSDTVLLNSIDCDKIKGHLFLRTRKEGDKFSFYNRKVSKSLKKLFNEYSIPVEQRNCIPILCDDDGVVWVYGFGVNKRNTITPNTNKAMPLGYTNKLRNRYRRVKKFFLAVLLVKWQRCTLSWANVVMTITSIRWRLFVMVSQPTTWHKLPYN
jgi:tRNA(Ile)-lysidine synthetase-like protein